MFNINDIVQIIDTNIHGKIIKIYGTKNKNYAIIECNNKIVKISQEKIKKIENFKIADNNKYLNNSNRHNTNSINFCLNQDNNFIPEIMLRHQTAEIAIFNLDKFIDEAICRNIKVVKIIHGKHGGILRNAVHDYLKNSKNVIEFHLGNYYEGQYGVTIATLK